jgi:hypothetical protein
MEYIWVMVGSQSIRTCWSTDEKGTEVVIQRPVKLQPETISVPIGDEAMRFIHWLTRPRKPLPRWFMVLMVAFGLSGLGNMIFGWV